MSVSSRAGSLTQCCLVFGFGDLVLEEHAVIYLGMDVHQKSTTSCLFDVSAETGREYRTVTRPTTAEGIGEVLKPYSGRCQAALEVGTQRRTSLPQESRGKLRKLM